MTARWLSRDRIVVLAALAGITALAWLYLVVAAQRMAAGMTSAPDLTMSNMTMSAVAMPGMSMPEPWDAAGFALTFTMWWVMMLGMMLPSAAPMILLYATIARHRRQGGANFIPVSVFAAGYLLAWGVFSAAAAVLQWRLDQAALLSPMLQTKGSAVGGAIFIAAGIYQFTPFKYACLRHCRSPFAFLLNHWRDGWGGALAMGWRHGLYCLGCCWVLMLLLFAVGVMNLAWVAVLAAFVLAEKALPRGVWIARVAGMLMVAFGVYLISVTAG